MLKKLYETRAKAANDLKAIREKAETEKRMLNADELSAHEACCRDIEGIDAQIKAVTRESALNIDNVIPNQEPKKEAGSDMFSAFLRGETKREVEFRLDPGIISGRRSAEQLAEIRAQSAIDGALGGVFVPVSMASAIENAMLDFANIRQVCTVIRTGSGEKMIFPTSNDTTNEATQIGENSTASDANLATSSEELGAFDFTSGVIKVPYSLMRDSAFNVEAWIGAKIGERHGRAMATKTATGSGAGTVRGLITKGTLGVTTASSTAVTAAEVIDLFHSVDPAYRPGASWMVTDAFLKAIRKLTDAVSGQFLWQPGLSAGMPDMLLGKPYMVNNSLQAMTAALVPAVFGDMKKYYLREVGTIRLKRLEERYAEADQIAFIGNMSWDGTIVDAGTNPIKYLKMRA